MYFWKNNDLKRLFIHRYIRSFTSTAETINVSSSNEKEIMNRFSFIVSVLLASIILINDGQAKEAYLDLVNDPHHPQLVTVTDVQYQIVGNKYLEFSGILTVHEELDEGTNVKISVSPDFPYARMLNNMDVNICAFCRREMPIYGRLVDSSDGQLPDRCPILPGVYAINNMRIDLDRWPLLWRGFNTAASITLHKNGRVLSKWDIACSITP